MDTKKKAPRTDKFRLTLADDVTHRQIGLLRFTRWSLLVTVISAAVLLLAGAFAIVSLTPLKTAIPGYPTAAEQREIVRNTLAVDSLEHVITRWEYYAGNLRRVFEGEDPVRIDSIVRRFAADTSEIAEKAAMLKADSLVRDAVRSGEQFSVGQRRDLSIEGKHCCTPVKGVVSEQFEPVIHPYAVVSAPAGSMVMAVLDGTVVSATRSDSYGYTLMIQHDDDIISVYTYLEKTLKEPGDKVTAGTPVAQLGGGDGTVAKGDYLRIEIWSKGQSVDPQQFINF